MRETFSSGSGFVNGIATGAFVSAIVFLLLFLALDLGVGDDHKEYVAAALTGIGALGAAWLALLGVQRQIRNASEIEDRRRRGSCPRTWCN